MTKCKTFSSANLVLFSLLRPLGPVQIATSAKGIGNKAVAVELNLPLRQHLIEDFTKKEKRVLAAITCPTNFSTQDGNGMGLRGLLLAPNSLLMAKLHPVRGESLHPVNHSAAKGWLRGKGFSSNWQADPEVSFLLSCKMPFEK